MPTYTDLYQSADARAWADSQAQQAYHNALASGATSSAALDAAKFAWQKKLDEATQTGMWNGQWNNPQEQWFTGQFGQWYGAGGAPATGQQTLTAQQQQYNQAYQNSGMFGQYYAPGTAPTQGQQTLGAQDQANQLALSQAGLTGYLNAPGAATGAAGGGTQTLAGQQQQFTQGMQQQQFAAQQQQLQQQNAQAYLQMLSQLRGPADWAKYQQVLGSTPNGMRDLAAAAMGQYTPGGGATTGYQPQAVNLNTMQQQIAGQGGYGGYGQQGAQPTAQMSPAMYQQMQAARAQQQGGAPSQPGNMQYDVMQQQQPAWGSGIGVGGQGATPEQQQQAQGGGTNMYGGQQQQYNLPAPNQIAAQSWNNMAPSQQQMLLGQYEANGWDKNDVQALYNQALPKYAQNQGGAGTWRLQ